MEYIEILWGCVCVEWCGGVGCVSGCIEGMLWSCVLVLEGERKFRKF